MSYSPVTHQYRPGQGAGYAEASTAVAALLVKPGGAPPSFTIMAVYATAAPFGNILRMNGPGGAFLVLENSAGELACALYDDAAGGPDASVELTGAQDGYWHWIAVVHDGVADTLKAYVDAVEVDSASTAAWAPTVDAGNYAALFFGVAEERTLLNLAIFDRVVTADELLSLRGRPIDHDYRDAVGYWAGETPPCYWRDGVVGGQIANAGDGGACAFIVADGMYAEPVVLPLPDPPVPLIGSIGRYPPVRAYYTLPGTVGGMLRAAGPRVSRLFFPDGGGFGSAALRWWFRRPASPIVSGGTLGQIGVGDATITVGLDPTEHITVTVDDGTVTVTDTAVDPISGMTWVAMTVVLDAVGEELLVYINSVAVAVVDVSTLTIPDADTGMSFTVGTKNDGTAPLDFDASGIAAYGEVLDAGEIQVLFEQSWTFDARNPDPTGVWDPVDGDSPTPLMIWIESFSTYEVIPDAGELGDEPLVPLAGTTSITEPSDFHAWPLGDHKLGVYSSAWWPESAHDPDVWAFAFATSVHEDVFGECPRVVGITPRGDGALLLDLDARMHPGIGFALTAPDDLSGEAP